MLDHPGLGLGLPGWGTEAESGGYIVMPRIDELEVHKYREGDEIFQIFDMRWANTPEGRQLQFRAVCTSVGSDWGTYKCDWTDVREEV